MFEATPTLQQQRQQPTQAALLKYQRRSQLYDLLLNQIWIVLVAIMAFAVLSMPSQVLELYRVMYADQSWVDFLRFAVGLAFASAAVWASSMVGVAFADDCDRLDGRVGRLGRMLPYVLGSLPLLGAALGHLWAEPDTDNANQALADSEWVTLAKGLTDELQVWLPLMSVALITMVVVLMIIGYRSRAHTIHSLFYAAARKGTSLSAMVPLVVIIVTIDLAFLISPVSLPRAIGTLGVVCLFIATLAFVVGVLTLISGYRQLPIIPVLLLAAALLSTANCNDNHAVRTIDRNAPVLIPDIASSFESWLDERPDLKRPDLWRHYPNGYPVYIVAAQGGGIYAAQHAATVLARLQDRYPRFREHLFAISGVSGGSVGAALFAAVLQSDRADAPAGENGCKMQKADEFALERVGPLEKRIQQALACDHLAPLAAAMLFPDFTQRFLPFPLEELDRALALESSFEDSLKSEQSDPLSAGLVSGWSPAGSLPALLLNTTDSSTGLRYVIAPFTVDPKLNEKSAKGLKDGVPDGAMQPFPFKDSLDMRLSTAAIASARFPWITPAALAKDGENYIRLVDGGYVDNSGLETALDVVERLKDNQAAAPVQPNDRASVSRPKPRFIIIAIGNADLTPAKGWALGEMMTPVRAMFSTRASRSFVALDRARRAMRPQMQENLKSEAGSRRFSDLRTVTLQSRFYDLPLGWHLSKRTQKIISLQSGQSVGCALQANIFEVELPPGADCVHRMIEAELGTSVSQTKILSDGK